MHVNLSVVDYFVEMYPNCRIALKKLLLIIIQYLHSTMKTEDRGT